MVEHVGEEQIDVYARRLWSLLGPGGRLLNHGIAKLKDFDTPDEGAFSERFVFPDGVPLPLSRICAALERAEFTTTHVEGLQGDYARTIATGPIGSTRAGTTRCASPASSARGSGGCTSAPRDRASKPAGRRSTRCSRTAEARVLSVCAPARADERDSARARLHSGRAVGVWSRLPSKPGRERHE